MSTAVEALIAVENALNALDDAAQAIAEAAVRLRKQEGGQRLDQAPVASRDPGVAGIESSDTKLIESVLRIAQVVGQRVQIDYTDELGRQRYARPITPTAFAAGPGIEYVVARDHSGRGSLRRFRIDRITRVGA